MVNNPPTAKTEIELDIQDKPAAQPANHFVVSYIGDSFALDLLYIHPHDLHTAKRTTKSVPATIIARIALSYLQAKELRKKLDEMIESYERQFE
jgi:hypothetical protein